MCKYILKEQNRFFGIVISGIFSLFGAEVPGFLYVTLHRYNRNDSHITPFQTNF